MRKFLVAIAYSPQSWARMMQSPDDRMAVALSLVGSFGGSVESLYWEAGSGTAYMTCDLPDSQAALAATLTALKTGGYSYIEPYELLTEEQLLKAVDNASDVLPGIISSTGIQSVIGEQSADRADAGPDQG